MAVLYKSMVAATTCKAHVHTYIHCTNAPCIQIQEYIMQYSQQKFVEEGYNSRVKR